MLLFNNSAWGMLKAFQSDTGYNDLDDWKFAEMAAGLGGKGVRVATRKALAAALEQAVADEKTSPPDRAAVRAVGNAARARSSASTGAALAQARRALGNRKPAARQPSARSDT